jgi:hypothetical protein
MISFRRLKERFAKKNIPESKELDQEVRKRRFGSKIDPILEREFYRWMQFQEKIEIRIEKYKEKINRITNAITYLKQSDKQFKEKMQFAQQQIFQYKNSIERLEYKLTEEKEKKLDKRHQLTIRVAKYLAEKYAYQQLTESASSIGIRGLEVYGDLEINYPNEFEWLISDGVLDKACYFAVQKYKPELVNIVDFIDLKKYTKSPVLFKETMIFRTVPDRPFKRAVFYAPKPLREYIRWIENYVLFIKGYRTPVILGKCYCMLLGWALPDFPQILITATPKQHQAIYQAQIKSEDLRQDMIDLLQKVVFYYRREAKINEMRVIEAQMDSERMEKRWSHLLDKMESEKTDEPETPKDAPKVIYSQNPIFYVVIGFLSIIVIVLIIFGFLGGG